MKKASLFLLIVTLIFGAFTAGLFVGRSYASEPILLSGSPAATAAPQTDPPGEVVAETQPDTTDTIIDINSAGLADLQTLPGIGPVLAQRILDYREANGPFESTAQLAEVSGIGEKRLAAILEYICIGGAYENSGS